MKKVFLLIALGWSLAAGAQVNHVSLQASGLTCSMCSNAINKALKTLDFIQKIETDIKTYTFELFIKPGQTADFDLIKKKVENAGFTVSGFVATCLFNQVQVPANEPLVIDQKKLLFTGARDLTLNGYKKIKVLDRGFVSPKEYRNNAFPVSAAGTYNVTLL